MLHTKFVEIGSPVLEKILEGFLPYMGVAAILVMYPDAANKLSFPYPRRLHIKLAFDWPKGFVGEDV